MEYSAGPIKTMTLYFLKQFTIRTFHQSQVKVRLAVLAATNCTPSQIFYSKQNND